VIDVSKMSLSDPDYLISKEDIENWEKINQRIPDNSILFLRTGYGEFWPDPEKYFGTSIQGAESIPHLHFPGLSPEAAEWLVENRSIKAIGIDTPSIDFGQSKDYKTHQILYKKNISGLENVANLHLLPATGAWVIALPMKIGGGSGGPVRIAALLPAK